MKEETKGEIIIFGSTIFTALTGILVKMASEYFSGMFIVFVRFAVSIILGALVILIRRQKLKLHDKKDLLLQGIFGAIAGITLFVAIKYIGAGRAVLLNTTYPIFGAIVGLMFFKDKISLNIIVALVLGFVGVVFVFYDGSGSNLLGDILGLISGLSAGISIHFLNRARQKNSTIVVYLIACIIGLVPMALSIPDAIPQLLAMDWKIVLILGTMSVISFVAITMLINGFKHVPPVKASIITFLAVPLTIVFGYFLLGEQLKPKFIIGAVLIIIGLVINSIKLKQQVKE